MRKPLLRHWQPEVRRITSAGFQSAPENQARVQSKGEKSRQVILGAALECIAKNGLHRLTHRSIAAQAGVPVSLTTYFFSSLDDLIAQAFDHFVLQTVEHNNSLLRNAAEYIDAIPLSERNIPAVRRQIHAKISRMIVDFIMDGVALNSTIGAVEVNFFYLYQRDASLQQRVSMHHDRVRDGIADVMRQLLLEHADTDASLLLGTIHRLEFDCINNAKTPSRKRVVAEIERLLSLILGV